MVCAMTVVTTARGAPHRSLSASNALIQVSSWSTGFASALLHPAMLTMLLRMASVLHWSIVATVLTTMAITTASTVPLTAPHVTSRLGIATNASTPQWKKYLQ